MGSWLQGQKSSKFEWFTFRLAPRGVGVLPYITYTVMCRPTGLWFWSSWFTTGYPFQRRFLERGIKNCGSRLYLLLKIVADYEEAFIWCISRTTKDTQVPPPGWEVMWSCAVHWFPVDSYLWKRYSQEGFRRDWSKLRYFDWPIPVFISFIEISRIYRKMK